MELTFRTLCGGSFLLLGIFIFYAITTGSRSLRQYIIARLFLTIPTIWILVTLVFIMMRVLPGDPITSTLKPGEDPDTIAELQARYGLDKPLYEQYFIYLGDVIEGDLGVSIAQPAQGDPVLKIIERRMPATLELVIPAVILMLLFGVFSGAFAAHKHKRSPDYSLRFMGIVFYSIPIFWMGLMLQLIFGLWLGWLPTSTRLSGRVSIEDEPTGFHLLDAALESNWDAFSSALEHMILPTITLTVALIGVFIRLTRSNMIEVLQEDYITAARARGVPEQRVVYRHALRNTFIPIMTLIGLQVAVLFGGAVLTETTFSWRGMGLLLYEGIASRNYPVVQGGVVAFAIIIGVMSTITDIIYAFVDPRIRY